MSTFSRAIYYPLNEGSGTTVHDALANGPDGTIVGTQTGVWANAGCVTVDNASHAAGAGDNAIRLASSYIDELFRLDTLENASILVLCEYAQPRSTYYSWPHVWSYGNTAGSPGGYGIGAEGMIPTYAVPGGSANVSRGAALIDPITSGYNDQWFSIGIQIDRFDGKIVMSAHQNGHPARGARIFGLESAPPSADASHGLVLLARNSAATFNNYLGRGTKLRRFFAGRTQGEQRHNLPKFAKAHYDAAGNASVLPFMVS